MSTITGTRSITKPSHLDAEYRNLRAQVATALGITGKRFRIAPEAIQLWIDFSGSGDWVRHTKGLDAARDVVRGYSRSQNPARFRLSINY